MNQLLADTDHKSSLTFQFLTLGNKLKTNEYRAVQVWMDHAETVLSLNIEHFPVKMYVPRLQLALVFCSKLKLSIKCKECLASQHTIC